MSSRSLLRTFLGISFPPFWLCSLLVHDDLSLFTLRVQSIPNKDVPTLAAITMPGCGLSNFIKFRLNSENRAGSARHLLIKAVVEECPKQIGGIVSEGGAAISEAVALETEA